MEKYFNNVSKIHYRGEKLQDIHPENAYQVKSIKYYDIILKNSFILSRTELPLNSSKKLAATAKDLVNTQTRTGPFQSALQYTIQNGDFSGTSDKETAQLIRIC